jgi:hypothetical protein
MRALRLLWRRKNEVWNVIRIGEMVLIIGTWIENEEIEIEIMTETEKGGFCKLKCWICSDVHFYSFVFVW